MNLPEQISPPEAPEPTLPPTLDPASITELETNNLADKLLVGLRTAVDVPASNLGLFSAVLTLKNDIRALESISAPFRLHFPVLNAACLLAAQKFKKRRVQFKCRFY